MRNSVLIIDDSRHFAESVGELLAGENWDIESALDGEKGLRRLADRCFDVVLLDLKMPIMSGLEFLRHLEERKLTDRNYVIVLTGEITIENAVDSLRLGARDFIQKPALVEQPELFLERIRKGFGWQRQRASNEQLLAEKRKALEESRLIVKSVGHDISGSYFSSLMLRLRMVEKTLARLAALAAEGETADSDRNTQLQGLAQDGLTRLGGVITLLEFIRQLGDKLKHLGEAISVDPKSMHPIDLSTLARQSLDLFTLTRPDIHLVRDFHPEPLMIPASPEDLHRVLMNLMDNAVRAMPNGGVLTVRTYTAGDEACLEVTDTGIGIPPEVQDKVWRPDFTHWEGESGTGLGLLICKKAVESHNGRIGLVSQPGAGTTFTIAFKFPEREE